MNIILLGPSGSGKGTQAELLSKKFNLIHFSTGEFLREVAKSRPDINEWINKKGQLVPDEITFGLVKEHFEGKKVFDGILFDGYPRSISQWHLLKRWFKEIGSPMPIALLINISDSEIVKRLSARREDPLTGKIYNLITDPPPPSVDKDSLVVRADDQPEKVQTRVNWYKDSVMPLVKELETEGILTSVDGERPIEVIFNDLVRIIEEKGGSGGQVNN